MSTVVDKFVLFTHEIPGQDFEKLIYKSFAVCLYYYSLENALMSVCDTREYISRAMLYVIFSWEGLEI